jgi:hypothetical protein
LYLADKILGLGKFSGQPKHHDPVLVEAARKVVDSSRGAMTVEQKAAWDNHKQGKEIAPAHLSPSPANKPVQPLPSSPPTHLSPAPQTPRPLTPISGEHSEEEDAERAKVVQMQQSQKMVSILTQEDVRRQKREPNIHRLSLFLEALDRAEAHPKGVEAGLRQSFEESPLLNRLLAVVRPNAK